MVSNRMCCVSSITTANKIQVSLTIIIIFWKALTQNFLVFLIFFFNINIIYFFYISFVWFYLFVFCYLFVLLFQSILVKLRCNNRSACRAVSRRHTMAHRLPRKPRRSIAVTRLTNMILFFVFCVV